MANVRINGISYNDVPQVNVPLAVGEGNAVFFDTSTATVTAGDIINGKVAFNGNGAVTGQLTTVSVSQNADTKVLTIS